jgi:hypothetical protein
MFRDRRHLRRWAIRVLLVWLFGIATGIAHACSLRVAEQHQDIASASVAYLDSVVPHGHDRQSPDADGQANCLDFCEKASVSAPSLKFKLDPGGDIQSAALLPSPSPWVAVWVAQTSALPHSEIATRGGPPLRIAFQRLAL